MMFKNDNNAALGPAGIKIIKFNKSDIIYINNCIIHNIDVMEK